MNELKQLHKYFFKYKYHFVIGIIITIASQIFTVFTPEYVGNAINGLQAFVEKKISSSEIKNVLFKNIILIITTTLIAGFFTFWMRQTIIVMSRHIEFDLKNDIFRHYEKLSQSFYKQNRTGDLMSRISEDVSKVRMYVGPAVMYSLNTFIRMTVVFVQMYLISPKLTLYALIPIPFLSFFMYTISQQIKKKSFDYQQNLSKLSSFSQEVFSGIRIIKAYSMENRKTFEYENLTQNSKNYFVKLMTSSSLISPLMVFLIGLSNLIIIYIGGLMYANGVIAEIGIIAQFVLYINMLTWPIASLGWVMSLVQEAASSQKRINEFLNKKPDIVNYNKNQCKISGDIEFKNVYFTYPDTGIEALCNVSFKIKKGQTLAILGKTGSGKSTILNLISRLYDIEKGEILIDGKSIKEINLTNLREAITMVPQDSFLFSDTIKNNIKFGKYNACDEEIIRYAKYAEIHNNIINFEKQYDTILGERGLTLSGGQKQRISIARALIKNAHIILLDDALSAVDTETEEKILQNIENITSEKTKIIVTHRISSAKNADIICVLEQGKIIEYGTNYQLIKKEGYYADLYKKQLQLKEL